MRPRPLAQASVSRLRRIRGICFDIDDTFSTEGKIHPQAFAALWRARKAGFRLAAVTGRPAGWCDHICRMWPVDAVVGENGAFTFAFDADRRRVVRRFRQPESVRRRGQARLAEAAKEVLAAVPGTKIAADQAYRIADLAIDFAEDTGPLGDAAIDRIVEILEGHGATCKISSIHVNAYFGRYDKRGMLLRLCRERFAMRDDQARRQIAYIGDSPNDEPLFEAFDLSVGVRNLEAFLPRLKTPPAFLTRQRSGKGFAELVRVLLQAAR